MRSVASWLPASERPRCAGPSWAYWRSVSIPAATPPRASSSGLPISRVTRRASSSTRSATASAARFSAAPRSPGAVAAQPGNAARAAATAATTASLVATGTSTTREPSAGSSTVRTRPLVRVAVIRCLSHRSFAGGGAGYRCDHGTPRPRAGTGSVSGRVVRDRRAGGPRRDRPQGHRRRPARDHAQPAGRAARGRVRLRRGGRGRPADRGLTHLADRLADVVRRVEVVARQRLDRLHDVVVRTLLLGPLDEVLLLRRVVDPGQVLLQLDRIHSHGSRVPPRRRLMRDTRGSLATPGGGCVQCGDADPAETAPSRAGDFCMAALEIEQAPADEAGRLLFRLAGSLDLSTVDQLRAATGPACGSGSEVVLDLSGVTLCDSTGVGT